MTFTELRTAVCEYCNLTSPEAQTRVGKAINRHYRRITASLGLEAARFVTRSASMTLGVATVTFTEIEKIDRIRDTTTATAIRLIPEVSVHLLRSTQPGTGAPCQWAFQNADADSVTVLFDTVPQTAYSLQADGWTTLSDLSGTAEPVFPESYHDILVWFVISDELLKKEKDKLAAAYHAKATTLLSELRFFLADTHTRDLVQGSAASQFAPGSASGGASGNTGGTAYTQSALLTFDLGAGIVPFAVARSDAPYVANLGAEFLGNVTSDRLIGRDTVGAGESEQLTVSGGLEFTGSGGIQRSALTGDVAVSAGSTTTTIGLLAVTTAKINDLAVTTGKIALLAVDTAQLAASAVTNAKVSASAAIASTKLDLSAIAQDLKFTDATYDIGKTGATRPRDGFFSRAGVFGTSLDVGTSLAVGTTSTLTGVVTFGNVASHVLGAVGTPSVTFTGDLNTGAYSSGADAFDIATGGVKALGIDSTQFIDSPTQPRCVAYHNTTQAFVSGTNAVLALNAEDIDVGAMHDTVTNNSRITIPTGGAGLYLVIASTLTDDAKVQVVIRKNGTTAMKEAQCSVSTFGVTFTVTALLVLAAADYLEIHVTNNSAGGATLGSATRSLSSELSVVKLW